MSPSCSATRGHGRARAIAALVAFGALALLASTLAPALGPVPGAGAQGVNPSSTTVPASAASATPTGPVAYATADGRVWVGEGSQPPVEIAQGAAIGRGGQAAVEISPGGDYVAFIRADGSLVIVPIGGGPPIVLATDAVTTSLGRDPSFAWDALGEQIAYLAKGTPDMVAPKPATPEPLKGQGAYRMPLPQGVLGDVVKVVGTDGVLRTRIGDPSLRSFVGVTASPADDLMILDSVIPGTTQRYTFAIAGFGSAEETPSLFSADDAVFSPDGRYIFAVAPAKGDRQLVQIETETLERTTLHTDDDICAPSPSPDGTRIAFGAGPGCSRIKLVVTGEGGPVVDATPPRTPDTATFGVGELGWTAEGRFVTTPDCRADAGRIDCDRPTMFLNPDTGRVIDGAVATTVAPQRVPRLQDLYLDIDLRGPLGFRHSFSVDEESRAGLTESGANAGRLSGRLVDGGRVVELELQVEAGRPWAAGTISVTDPESGIDRTFAVLARANLVGLRVFSLSGTWYSTEDLPFATGRFNLAIRRR